MRVSEQEFEELEKRMSKWRSVPPLPVKMDPVFQEAVKQSKYRNQKVVIDGITFDSKKEGEKYRQLKQLEQANRITNLTLQPVYELAPAVTISGKKKQALRYIADFQYIENGKQIVLDVKGMLTDVYKIKRHLMKHIHGIEILEV